MSDPIELLSDPAREDNSYHVVTSSGTDETAILDGFTVMAGVANGPIDSDGAGMLNVASRGSRSRRGGSSANPYVVNCTFYQNASQGGGGGVYTASGSPTFENCEFIENIAMIGPPAEFDGRLFGSGGGMYNRYGNPTLIGCSFVRNRTPFNEAGFRNSDGRPTLIDCTFIANAAGGQGDGPGPAGHAHGGGIDDVGGQSTLINCVFMGNSAVGGGLHPSGGGIHAVNSNLTLTNCLFSGNWADAGGGGLANVVDSRVTLINCTFSGNYAGSKFEDDGGGGILNWRGGNATITNCIFWGNRDSGGTDESAQINNSTAPTGGGIPNTSVVRFSCIQGLNAFAGNQNIGLDPRFMRNPSDGGDGWGVGTNDDFGDLRLRPDSPSIDAGDNAAPPADTTDLDANGDTFEPLPIDLDGNRRVTNPTVDMGAYERGDCNGNGRLDSLDIADGNSLDCTGNGIPDECEADCNGNGIADSCEIADGRSTDANTDGVPDECQPQLVRIMDGVATAFAAGTADTFILPRIEDSLLNQFLLETSEDLSLISARSTYTGPIGSGGGSRRGGGSSNGPRPLPRAPQVVGFTSDGGGRHTVDLDPAPAPGQWLKLTLTVRGQSPSSATFDIWLAHHPDDINQDGTVDIRDTTAFGELFRNGGSPLLIDLNDDGVVDMRDATTFGEIWHGTDTTQPWNGHRLPDRPE